MIRKIGIIYQGANDRGFLEGLKRRLGCDAEFVDSRTRGRNKLSIGRDAAKNWSAFKAKGVDLVVRLTDSEGSRWQDIKKKEIERFPEDMKGVLICGVNQFAVESWLAIDRGFLEEEVGIPASEKISSNDLVGRVKSAISRHDFSLSSKEVVRHLVESAPLAVFKRWLKEPSFRGFYDDCRGAAKRQNCPINDEVTGQSE